MEKILAEIENALERKGISAAAASRLAVGNAALIKNLNHPRGEKRLHPVEALHRLTEVLDLEFYIGPPRTVSSDSASPPGFMDAGVAFDSSAPLPDEARRTFLPIPYSSQAGPDQSTGPVAFSQKWFADNEVAPDDLRFVKLQDETMIPALPSGALLLIDESKVKPDDSSTYAVLNAGQIGAGRITKLTVDTVAFVPGNRDIKPSVHKIGGLLMPFRVLGRVIWSGHSWR